MRTLTTAKRGAKQLHTSAFGPSVVVAFSFRLSSSILANKPMSLDRHSNDNHMRNKCLLSQMGHFLQLHTSSFLLLLPLPIQSLSSPVFDPHPHPEKKRSRIFTHPSLSSLSVGPISLAVALKEETQRQRERAWGD